LFVVGKLVELEELVQLASILTAIVNGPFTVNCVISRRCHFH